MGRWGYFPEDSDGAFDYLGDIDDAINQKLGEIFNKKLEGKWATGIALDRAGIVQLLLEKQHSIKQEYVKKAVECLNIVLGDYGFIKEFRDPEKAGYGITAVRDAMQNLIDEKLPNPLLPPRRFIRKYGGKICPPTIIAPKDWLKMILLPKKAFDEWMSYIEMESRKAPPIGFLPNPYRKSKKRK